MMAVVGAEKQNPRRHRGVEWPSYFSKEARERGLRLALSQMGAPRGPTMAPTASKAAGALLICTLSKHAAEEAGFDDAI